MRIHERGDSGHPPLVLLHGLASSPRCWERNLPALGRGRRLLLVDFFAGGVRRFSLAEAAALLARELDARGLRTADVVAHSMGGLVALHLAATHANLLSRLVLVDVPAAQLPRPRMARLAAMVRSSMRPAGTAATVVLASVLRTSPLALLTATRATAMADLLAEAAEADVPTLLVWGSDDRIVPLEVGERLAAHMPAAELCVIPHAGHQPMWEAPEAFNAVVDAYLRRGLTSRPMRDR